MKKLATFALAFLLAAQSMFSVSALSVQDYSFSDGNPLVPVNYPLARKAAGEGIVLLENKNDTLPLGKNNTVSLFGIGQIDYVAGGTGSGIINTEYKVNFIDGMRDAEKNGRLTVNEEIAAAHQAHYDAWKASVAEAEAAGKTAPKLEEIALTEEEVNAAKAVSDTAIYIVRRTQGEGSDRTATKGEYYLSDTEAENLALIDEAGFENFIIVINAGTAIDTYFFSDYASADALLYAWLPGVEGGLALADVVTGDVNPSGKLTDTFLKSYDYYPSAETFAESQTYVNYFEDIYNGYRWFETFDPEYTKVSYPFGYGLSYTDFEIAVDSVTNDGEDITVETTVTNIGDIAGKEVVQVYFSAPQGLLGKPAKELAAYAKTELIKPGKSQSVTLTFPISDMSSFDDLGKTGNKSAYVLEAGDYEIYVGNSVRNAGENGVAGTYTVASTTVTEQLTSLLTPGTLEKRLVATENEDGTISATYERLSVTMSDDGSYELDTDADQNVIDAENYSDGSSGLETPVLPIQDNLKYVTGLTTGKYISVDVSVETASLFTLSLMLSNSGEAVSAPFKVYVDDTEVSGPENVTVTNTGSGTTDGTFVFKSFDMGVITLNPGKNTIKIESQTDSIIDIDSLIFKPANDVPKIYADKANVIEAESFYLAYNDPNDGNNMNIGTETAFGETLVCKMQGLGNYIEYRLIVEEAGTYDFLFNYAATGNSTTPYAIYVNGVDQEVSYTLAKTSPEGSTSADGNIFYNTTADAEPFQITLPAGFVTLRIKTVGASPNINRFTLTKAFELPEGYTLVSADESTVIEAENWDAFNPSTGSGIPWVATKYGEKVVNALTNNANDANPPRYLEYNLYFMEAGTYGVVFNAACTGEKTSPFNFKVNGNALEVDTYTFPKTTPSGVTSSSDSDAYYHTYADMPAILMEFPEGQVTFRVESGTGGMPNLNKFTLSKAVKYETEVPAGYDVISSTESTVIQAESYDANYDALKESNNMKMNSKPLTEGDSVGQIVMENIKVGSYLDYNLFFTYGGTYTVTYNYAATGPFTNPYELYINGEKLTHSDYSMVKTSLAGSTWADTFDYYFIFTDSDPITYTFPQGSVTLRLKAENGTRDMPNLNCFTFECIEADIPDVTVPDAGDTGTETTPDEETTAEERLPDYTEADADADIIMFEDVYYGNASLDDFVSQMTNLELIKLAGGHPPVNGCSSSMGRMIKYHIPAVSTGDGGAGIRTNALAQTTWWPCSTMLACTWNLELIHEVGNAVGAEGARLRWDTWLAPGMNIHRNPLCGRNFEYYSEDPLIAGNCAAEITLGAREQGMHTVPKHFAVNNKENGRSVSDSRISERALREIYLKGFEILVKKADPRYIMTSYNLINGTEAAENHDLQTAILRDEWGFDGITMTDWNNSNSRPAAEIKAGSTIRKPYGEINELVGDLAEGKITREDLKNNAKLILPVLFDSMSFEAMINTHTVTRSDETMIPALDYNYINDDHFGVAKNDFTTSAGVSYKAGEYFEQHAWTPNLNYISGQAVGMSLATDVSNANVDFEDKTYFLDFVVDVEETGNYDIEVFLPNTGNRVEVYVDDELAGIATAKAALKNEVVKRSNPLTVKMTSGLHTVRIKGVSYVAFERIAITPNFEDEVVTVDAKVFNVVNSDWGLNYETKSGEMGDYIHITPDLTESVDDRRTDHWGLSVNESVYKYMAFCYRTNYDGDMVAAGKTSGQSYADTNKYTFKADKLDEWTTVCFELTGDELMTDADVDENGNKLDQIFRQMHFSPFGQNALNASEELYFDLYHFGFFKSEADAKAYCAGHAIKPVSGKVYISRDSEASYYDDVIRNYNSFAVFTLTDQNGTVVARTGGNRLGVVTDENGTAIVYSFSVPDGEYTLSVRKPGYVTKNIEVTVTDGKADIEDIYLVPGDISDNYDDPFGDGIVDIDDFIRAIRAFSDSAEEKLKMFTDIDEDGIVSVSDIALIKGSLAAGK